MKKKQVFVFTSILLSIGFVCRYFDRELVDLNSQSPWIAIWAISPFLLTLAFRVINKDWKGFGIKLNLRSNWKWYIISVFIFPIITTLNLIIGKLTGSVVFTDQFSLQLLALATITGFIPMFFKNIFEEFAWRGYLTQKFNEGGMKRNKNHVLVGIIWAVWHLPYLDLMIKSYSDLSLWFAVPLFLIGVIITAFVYGEIRLRSQTVWTVVLLHTIGNAITNPLIYMKMIKLVSGKEFIAAPGIDNFSYIIFMLILAIFLFNLKEKNKG